MTEKRGETAAAQERIVCALYRTALERAARLLAEGRTVPLTLLDEIARLEARVGVLVTLQLMPEIDE